MRDLHLACWDYDRVQPLIDGSVGLSGRRVVVHNRFPGSHAFRATDGTDLDIVEQSMSAYLAERSRGRPRFVGIPVFLSRLFRHSAIYVRAGAGIATPADLAGRRVGAPLYGQSAILAARGMLCDEHGVTPGMMRWVIGPLEAGEAPFPLRRPDADVAIEESDGTPLDAMLLDGRIDAIMSAAAPSSFLAGDPRVTRPWSDVAAAEADYFARTRIFPIMHLVGIRADLVEAEPELPRALYDAFEEARRVAMARLDGQWGAAKVMLPWANDELARTRALMGADFWPYGLEANRTTLDAMCRWSREQGLSARRLTADELFCDPGA